MAKSEVQGSALAWLERFCIFFLNFFCLVAQQLQYGPPALLTAKKTELLPALVVP